VSHQAAKRHARSETMKLREIDKAVLAAYEALEERSRHAQG
jgi:hypothetical protein